MRQEEPDGRRATPSNDDGSPARAAVHGLARDHDVEALRRLVVRLHERGVSAAVTVPGERLVHRVGLGQQDERLHRRIAREDAVRVTIVGDPVDDVARRAREQAAGAERERRRRRVLGVRAVTALPELVGADLEVALRWP